MATPSFVIIPDRYKAGKLYAQIPVDGTGDLSVVRGTDATRTNSVGTLVTESANVPRIDYTGGGCPALLVENAATNLALRSEEFDNAYWTKIGVAITANDAVAPNGTTTAELFTFTGTGYATSPASVLSSGTTYTLSVYVRAKNTSGVVRLAQNTSTDSIVTSQTYNVDTNWQRITFTFTAGATSSKVTVAQRFSGDTEFYYWGAQLETGRVATSYIPTVASTQTRNADVISVSSVSGLIGQTEGTLYIEINLTENLSGRRLIGLSDGTASNRIALTMTDMRVRPLKDALTNLTESSVLTSGTYKMALAYNATNIVVYLNGSLIITSTTVGSGTYDRIDLGQTEAGAAQFNDRISAAAIYTTRLSNSELASLTTL